MFWVRSGDQYFMRDPDNILDTNNPKFSEIHCGEGLHSTSDFHLLLLLVVRSTHTDCGIEVQSRKFTKIRPIN